MSTNIPLPTIQYSTLRTHDYDEPSEVEDSTHRRLRKDRSHESLDSLSESIDRLGQMGLNIAGEIEMQSHLTNELEFETDGVYNDSQALQLQAQNAQRNSETSDTILIVFIIVVLCIAIAVFIYKKLLK